MACPRIGQGSVLSLWITSVELQAENVDSPFNRTWLRFCSWIEFLQTNRSRGTVCIGVEFWLVTRDVLITAHLSHAKIPYSRQGRIKIFGAPRQWKNFRPLFQAVFLLWGCGGGITSQAESNTTPPSPKTQITNILFYVLNFASIIKF
jgi:hypothetical protein